MRVAPRVNYLDYSSREYSNIFLGFFIYIKRTGISVVLPVRKKECIVNKDKEGLKSVFSKHIAETHDLDKEIDEFLEFIDGKIVSYDEPTGYEGSYEMRAGEYYKKELGGDTKNIVTDAEKKYHIGFLSYQIYEKDEDYIGVDIIAITEVTDEVNGESVYIGN